MTLPERTDPDQTAAAPMIASPDDIDGGFAARAYHGTSHSPEQRGDRDRQGYADVVNGLYAQLWPLAKNEDQRAQLAEEMERFRQGYRTRLSAYLASHANVVSVLVAGPARFPAARMQKRGRWADNKAAELVEWKDRAAAAITRSMLDAQTPDERERADWLALQTELARSLSIVGKIDQSVEHFTRSAFTNSIAGKIERLARAGDVPLVGRALAWLAEHNLDSGRPAFTPRHKVWTFGALAEEAATRHQARAGKPAELIAEAGRVTLWADYQADRAQLRFRDKPGHELREKLKRAGWRWSPTNEAWQRQLTNAAIVSGKALLAGLIPPAEPNLQQRGPSA